MADNHPGGRVRMRIWRDFLIAAISVFRRPDPAQGAAERRAALDLIADQMERGER